MAVANKNPAPTAPDAKPTDSKAAKIGRFLVGSIFGVIFMVFCFVTLSVALRGPDTIKVNGSETKAGLIGEAPKDRLKIGDPAPDFALAQLGGDPVQLSKLRGKVVFINFWATWCDPCREEMPDIQRIYQKYKNQDVVVLAVNVRENADAAKSYFKTNNLTMPVLLDTTGAVPGGFRVTRYPETYIIDRQGRVGEFSIGAFNYATMEQKIQAVLARG
jgi:thiol-disulfide isomerase/thioredoxin